jgi:hypothetical protein
MSADLGAREFLAIWEEGRSRHPLERALVISMAAEPELSIDALAALPLGERDRRILAMRERVFGDRLEFETDCPSCATRVEWNLRIGDLLSREELEPPPFTEFSHLEWRLRLRAPDSRDLIAASRAEDVARARRILLERCVLSIELGGECVTVDDLTDDVAGAISAEFARIDPGASLSFHVACPDCRREWSVPFDPGAFFFAEIADRARELLFDIATLARAYGWRESDILDMSPLRRQSYLELVHR